MMLLSFALAAAMGTSTEPPKAPDCRYDRAAMLAMEPDAFDQDLEGGWRTLADRGCHREAADLLAAYAALPKAAGNTMILWHEGQMRAEAGQYPQAVALMQRTYKPTDTDPGYWNAYVDGTIAFLRRRDRGAGERASKVDCDSCAGADCQGAEEWALSFHDRRRAEGGCAVAAQPGRARWFPALL
ncbi:hypothetical protein ROV95_02095 [Stenotrophomonas maltophilia group sp. msm1]|uniref:hypothetical protein n=1 Tax=Stenotrophomonas maltophilia group sp. msm1 TaxID=3061099 RepID=UPI002893ACF9|nr:hypothetical protein [Stenotrophomonas maltophilia group sp. msm1]MDT3554970.1 hypothetical protein [Stenotrophomonas maltophilia group sp. msm1]